MIDDIRPPAPRSGPSPDTTADRNQLPAPHRPAGPGSVPVSPRNVSSQPGRSAASEVMPNRDINSLGAGIGATALHPQERSAEGGPPGTDQERPATSGDVPTIGAHPQAGARAKKPFWKAHKKLLIILAVVLLVVLAGGTVAALTVFRKDPPKPQPKPAAKAAAPVVKKPEPPKPDYVVSRLTGGPISPEMDKRPVTAIMIENSPEARPQSGLIHAGVVYEAVAEGGITRFLTLFQDTQPDYIGPVRSVRPYYLDWLMPYDAGVAHVGGSRDALDQIKELGVKDLDQFANGSYYHRVSNRYAPHNVYTSMGELDQLNAKKGYTSSTFTGFARKGESALPTPSIKSIDFNISGFLYNPHYDYDQPTNSYKRSEGGKPHVDERSNAQITPKVVVALVMGSKTVQAIDGSRMEYTTVGSGKAFIFQDGGVTVGTWSKADRKAPLVLTDTAGKPLALNAGQTWISVVSAESDVKV